ncbi:hypothetical protein ANO11243_091750 [Dothideomycetidae sp. 11243]|nr:hypothetical protein ANO11243_091750 [fungal sp. No.11243]
MNNDRIDEDETLYVIQVYSLAGQLLWQGNKNCYESEAGLISTIATKLLYDDVKSITFTKDAPNSTHVALTVGSNDQRRASVLVFGGGHAGGRDVPECRRSQGT